MNRKSVSPPGSMGYQYERVTPPNGIKDIPRYLHELLGGFFKRFFYIITLVWRTGPWILFAMSFISLFQGVTPVIGSLISKEIINEFQVLIEVGLDEYGDFISSGVFFLLVFFFIYKFPFWCFFI